jgi:hypothetical protein
MSIEFAHPPGAAPLGAEWAVIPHSHIAFSLERAEPSDGSL